LDRQVAKSNDYHPKSDPKKSSQLFWYNELRTSCYDQGDDKKECEIGDQVKHHLKQKVLGRHRCVKSLTFVYKGKAIKEYVFCIYRDAVPPFGERSEQYERQRKRESKDFVVAFASVFNF
jgi:hypothetical protein